MPSAAIVRSPQLTPWSSSMAASSGPWVTDGAAPVGSRANQSVRAREPDDRTSFRATP
jgi:hypothetical protein